MHGDLHRAHAQAQPAADFFIRQRRAFAAKEYLEPLEEPALAVTDGIVA